MKKIYFIAGEASGDALGRRMMSALRNRCGQGEVQFRGVGGSLMSPSFQNKRSLFPMRDINVMGLGDVLRRLPKLHGAINDTVKDITLHKPNVLVTIDSKGFNFRVLRRLAGILPEMKTVHVVSPSFWAFKHRSSERQLRPLKDGKVDLTLLLLPFEKPFYDALGMDAAFIGYPAVEELLDYRERPLRSDANWKRFDGALDENLRTTAVDRLTALQPGDTERNVLRESSGVHKRVLTICPGSRKGEIMKHMPILVDLMKDLGQEWFCIVPTTRESFELVNSYVSSHRQLSESVQVGSGSEFKHKAFVMAEAAVACSGTVVSELAYFGVPTVVIYKADKLTEYVARRIAAQRFVSIPNILANREAPLVSELLFDQCNRRSILRALDEVVGCERAQREVRSVLAAMSWWSEDYGYPVRPSEVAADYVLSLMYSST